MLYLFPPDVKGHPILHDRVPLGGVAEALDAWPEAAAIVRRQYRRLREAGVPVNVARSTVTNLLQLGVTAEATRVTRRWFAAQVSDPAGTFWGCEEHAPEGAERYVVEVPA